jgi:hypothetical protein
MSHQELAAFVREASKKAVREYLKMGGLDSPWEVPEHYIAYRVAGALSRKNFRPVPEFKLNEVLPPHKISSPRPARLDRRPRLDLALLKKTPDPWSFRLSGVIEFKRHNKSLKQDAELIHWLFNRGTIDLGMLAILVVGSSDAVVRRKFDDLAAGLTRGKASFWRSDEAAVERAAKPSRPGISSDGVKDRYWDVRCLIPRAKS